MGKVLTILEVSKKQDYIFGSHKLKDNARRSAEINYVTGSQFFSRNAGELYSEKENFVYAGGGHTVLQFKDSEAAKEFTKKVTEAAMRQFNGLEVFARSISYDEDKTPRENLLNLSKSLEQKKSQRVTSFRQTSFGIEKLDGISYKPIELEQESIKEDLLSEYEFQPPKGWVYPKDFKELTFETENYPISKDNFIAVIHIDGNSMGSRVNSIYEKECTDWEQCCESLRRFSSGIQEDFEAAFNEMVTEITNQGVMTEQLPVRPVILAGDDVCFVTAGSIGLECSRIFLEKLSQKKNKEDGKYYSACAGVAIVHVKYPFHKAYEMAESLCENAKKFGVSIEENGSISAMDWHIQFGQLKDNLSELREEYITEDGNHLELRPVVVVNPHSVKTDPIRDYKFFASMCKLMHARKNVSRGKLKEWRTALKQGELETKFFLHDQEIEDILYHGFEAMYRTNEEKNDEILQILKNGKEMQKEPFRNYDGEKHCIFFDAIEMMDHAIFFEGEGM